MSTLYFGNVANTAGDLPGGTGHVGGGQSYTAWNYNKVYTCPGSGNQDIQDISSYCDFGGGTAKIRLAVYSSDGTTLMAESSGDITVGSGDGAAWKGSLSAGVITQYHQLVGGTNYRIIVSPKAGGNIDQYYTSAGYTADDHRFNTTDYTAGFPATAPLGTDFLVEACLRCGVQSAASASEETIVRQSICVPIMR